MVAVVKSSANLWADGGQIDGRQMVSDLYQRRNKYSSPKVTFSGASHAKDILAFQHFFTHVQAFSMCSLLNRSRQKIAPPYLSVAVLR